MRGSFLSGSDDSDDGDDDGQQTPEDASTPAAYDCKLYDATQTQINASHHVTGRNLATAPKLLFPDASGTWHVCVIGWRDNSLDPAEPSDMDPFVCDDSAAYYALDIIKDAQGARQIWSVGAMRLFPYCKSLDRGRWGTTTVPPSVLLHHAGALHSLQDIDEVPYLSGDLTVYSELEQQCSKHLPANETAILMEMVADRENNPRCSIDTSSILNLHAAKIGPPTCEVDAQGATCEALISAGALSCETDFCHLCQQAHACDHSCDFPCPDDGGGDGARHRLLTEAILAVANLDNPGCDW
eukprot:SAG31_NODE_17_length_35773_cov_25.999271_25_plen_298_part_00